MMAYKTEEIRSWTDEYLVEEYLMCCETLSSWMKGPDFDTRDEGISNMEENIHNIKIELSRRRIPIPPFP